MDVKKLITKVLHNYRPQTKFAKVMFLHLSVILFTGGGGMCGRGGVCGRGCVCGRGHACMVGGHAWWVGMHGGCVGACMAGGRGMHGRVGGMCGRGVCVAGGMHGRQGACMAGGVHGGGGVGGMCGRGVCMPHTHTPDTTIYGRSMRRQYASYWNAFLSQIFSVLVMVMWLNTP